jgi:hypothetical protein
MCRGRLFAAVLGFVVIGLPCAARGQLQEQAQQGEPALEQTPAADEPQQPQPPTQPPKEKLARIWANEPPLVRLARDRFGDEFTETDAKFFAAVAAGEWADFRPSSDAKYDAELLTSWNDSVTLKADRVIWLCSEPSATRLVPSRGIWLRGVKIVDALTFYRGTVPFSLTFFDCMLDSGLNVRYAKVQEIDIYNCCSAKVDGFHAQITENVNLRKTTVYGGVNFVEAQIAGDLDMNGSLVFHSVTPADMEKPGVAINLYDAKIDGDVKLSEKFRAYGTTRLTAVRIGRSLTCSDGQFAGMGESAIDADRARVRQNVSFAEGFSSLGTVDIRRVHIGGDLDLDGSSLNGQGGIAVNADLVDIAGQLYMGDGLNAQGEVRFVNAVVGKDVDCDNGHFLNPTGIALRFDSSVIGRSLRLGYDSSAPVDKDENLPKGFLARGAVWLYGTQVNQDFLAHEGQFEMPEHQAIVACNLRVASRVVLTCAKVQGQIDISGADIEHELDLRGSHFDASKMFNRSAIWANGMKIHGHMFCNQYVDPDQTKSFRVDGEMSFQFVTINMSWDFSGAQLLNPGGFALDASDCRVGGYVNINNAEIDGTASFSRAKIDGVWVLCDMVKPERTKLDMRFAHVWVIKDQSLDDWPPAGQLQLEGFVYDHFDDDSPLSVEDRLAWLRRQYAAEDKVGRTILSVSAIQRTDRIVRPTVEKHADAGTIIPVDFETAPSTPAPSMSAPSMIVDPQQEQQPHSYPMVVTDSSIEAPEPELVTTPPVAENSDAAPSEQIDSTSESTQMTSETAAPTAAIRDPAGRRYVTQPYTQLASVYRAIGQDEQANAVLVARAERLGELSPAFSAQALWYRYFGRLIGYGYEPFRAIKIGVGIVVIGTIVFAIGARRHLMAETKLAERVISQENESGLVTTTYPRFNAFVYSLDVFLPFVDLHQICYWIPGERATKPRSRNCLMHVGPYSLKWSGVLRTYFWFQTLAGWTLCTLLAAAVTGIVQS